MLWFLPRETTKKVMDLTEFLNNLGAPKFWPDYL